MSPFDSFFFFNYEVSPISVAFVFAAVYISYYLIFVKEYPKLICSNTDLNLFLTKNMVITRRIFWPLFWGFEAKIQTIVGSLLRPFISVGYEREFLSLVDGGEVVLDWSFTPNVEEISSQAGQCALPICIILPGLTGCSQSNYITNLVHAVSQKGYRAVVLNYRGKGGTKLKTPMTYCATSTQDFHEVVQHVHKKYPEAPLIACGISLGGIILFNYLAIHGKKTPLDAGFVISLVWNIYMSAASLETPINRILFNKTLAESLAENVRDNSELFASTVNLEPVYSSKTIREFDTHFTTRVFGYSSIDEYYSSASPDSKVSKIKVPLMCLCAGDDPFAPYESIPFDLIKKNPYMAMIYTSHGGHVGFLEGFWPRGTSLIEKLLQQYLCAIFENIDEFRKLSHRLDQESDEAHCSSGTL